MVQMNLFAGQESEMQTQRTDMWTQWGKRYEMNRDLGRHIYIYIYIYIYWSPPDSSFRGISQEIILQWVAIYFSRESSQPRD